MSKHTPGPWKVWGEFQYAVRTEQGGAVADCYDGKLGFHADDGAMKANARLIAAAPDGLEANKLAAQVIRDCMRDLPTYTGERSSFLRALKVLDAAIAKAEGRE